MAVCFPSMCKNLNLVLDPGEKKRESRMDRLESACSAVLHFCVCLLSPAGIESEHKTSWNLALDFGIC